MKVTVEQTPFQTGWLEKGKKQILDELQSDFPLKIDNYITKRAGLSLQIKIVKSTSLIISTKGQAILGTQKQCQLNGIVLKDNSLSSNVKNDMHSCPVSLHVMKQVGLDLCSHHEVDGYRHIIICSDYFTKLSEVKLIRGNTALTVATFFMSLCVVMVASRSK